MHAPKRSYCEIAGHNWQTTTASNYRTCQYPSCRAAQRYTNKRWVNVTQQHTHPQDDLHPHRQLGMFEGGGNE